MAVTGLTNTAIRTGVVTLLAAAGTAAGSRVYNSSTFRAQASDAYPVIGVYTRRTRDSERSMNAPEYVRTTTLQIECRHRVTADVASPSLATAEASLEAALDSLTDEVLDALLLDASWSLQWEVTPAPSVDQGPVSDGQGDALYGAAVITMELRHRRSYTPTLEDDFSEARINLDLIDPGDGPDGTYEATATITGLEA